MKSKALDKLDKTAPTTLSLSNLFLYSSKSLTKAWSVLKDFNNTEMVKNDLPSY